MAKFAGYIGFGESVEIKPGVYSTEIKERFYCGEILSSLLNTESSGSMTDNVTMSNQISFLADRFATDNFHAIKYVKFRDISWKVTKVSLKDRRLILTVGGVYNGG